MENESWKDLTRTIKSYRPYHRAVIHQIEQNRELFKGHFENEYGERYVIQAIIASREFPIYRIAGDETGWEWLQLLKVGSHIVMAENFFSLNEEEYKKAKKLVK